MKPTMKALVISDTHMKHNEISFEGYEDINTIIHCGDFSHTPKQVFSFCKWFGDLDFDNKILIAGNHDSYIETVTHEVFEDYCKEKGITYLHDTSTIINGIKIHGSPYSNEFGNWSFMLNDMELDKIWQKIPDDVEVLITHGPAYGVGDEVQQDIMDPNVGSHTLKYHINNRLTKMKYHLFGHIHEDYGIHKQEKYVGINASTFDWYKKKINKPHIIEL